MSNHINHEKIINIIENDLIFFDQKNILDDIKNISNTIPNNLTPLEKARYIYIKLGNLFCFDYRSRYTDNVTEAITKQLDYNEYINNYVSCIPMAVILNKLLNNIDGINSIIIPREIPNMRGIAFKEQHTANQVTINNKTYIFDLALDLYLIHSNCQTRYFGFQSDNNKFNVIQKNKLIEIDKKLQFNTNYLDDTILKIKNKLSKIKKNYNLFNNIIVIINSLYKKHQSHHEGKKLINLMLNEFFNGNYKEYNIYKSNDQNKLINFKTIYQIEYHDNIYYLIFSNNIGLIEIDEEIIKYCLNNNWRTNSNKLNKEYKKNKLYKI